MTPIAGTFGHRVTPWGNAQPDAVRAASHGYALPQQAPGRTLAVNEVITQVEER
jgi:hypothetical protein